MTRSQRTYEITEDELIEYLEPIYERVLKISTRFIDHRAILRALNMTLSRLMGETEFIYCRYGIYRRSKPERNLVKEIMYIICLGMEDNIIPEVYNMVYRMVYDWLLNKVLD